MGHVFTCHMSHAHTRFEHSTRDFSLVSSPQRLLNKALGQTHRPPFSLFRTTNRRANLYDHLPTSLASICHVSTSSLQLLDDKTVNALSIQAKHDIVHTQCKKRTGIAEKRLNLLNLHCQQIATDGDKIN